MKKFPEPMKRVQDARHALLNRCEVLLADAERKRLQSMQHKEQCASDIRTHADAPRPNGKYSPKDLLLERAWFSHLMQQLEHAMDDCDKKDAQVTQQRNALNKALQDCKIIENLTRRQKKQWNLLVQKTEQQEQDENAVITYTRRQQGYGIPATSEPSIQEDFV
jgi:hypothetical protein